jgi:hypothetical protein
MSALLVVVAASLAVALVIFWQGQRAPELAAGARRDPLAWVIARSPAKARLLAVVGVVVGLAILVSVGSSFSRVPWQLDAHSPSVMSSGGRCDPGGAVFTIVVNGSSYACGGGNFKCANGDVPIAYDRLNPSLCRVRSNVDGPSLYELYMLLFALAWLCFAGAVANWQDAPHPAATLLPQSKAYSAFVAALGAQLAVLVLSVLVYS